MGKTSISWCDYSWNPVRAKNKESGKVGWHCTHVTRACENCYAEALNIRLGTGLEFKPGNEKKLHIFLDDNMLKDPIRWHKRQKLKIFVCSASDLFATFVEKAWLDKIFSVIELCPDHTFQILTKRPARMREYLTERYPACAPRNVWAGISIAEQRDLDAFGEDLRGTNARVRWLSVEPMIGQVQLTSDHKFLRWVVVGGESGHGARHMPMQSAKELRLTCYAMRIPFFLKQMSQADFRHYDDFESFPEGLKVREFPC